MGSEDHGLWPGDRIRAVGEEGEPGDWPQPGDLGTLGSVHYMDWITDWDGHHALAGGSSEDLERAEPYPGTDPPPDRAPLGPDRLHFLSTEGTGLELNGIRRVPFDLGPVPRWWFPNGDPLAAGMIVRTGDGPPIEEDLVAISSFGLLDFLTELRGSVHGVSAALPMWLPSSVPPQQWVMVLNENLKRATPGCRVDWFTDERKPEHGFSWRDRVESGPAFACRDSVANLIADLGCVLDQIRPA
jgi:hypothetical protein